MNENCVEIICLPLYSGTPAEGKEVPTNNGIKMSVISKDISQSKR